MFWGLDLHRIALGAAIPVCLLYAFRKNSGMPAATSIKNFAKISTKEKYCGSKTLLLPPKAGELGWNEIMKKIIMFHDFQDRL